MKVSATNILLISYEISSLFTSMPLKEAIDIDVNLLFEHNTDLKITKAELKRLFEFTAPGTYLFFFTVHLMTK